MGIKKLCFFISGQNNHFDGPVRPFINWATELSNQDYEISFLLLNCGTKMNDTISKISNIKSIHVKSFKEIIIYLNVTKPNILITDDYFPRLRIISKIKSNLHIRTCIYVQILFGSHVIADVFNHTYLSLKDRILFGCLRYAFFNFLKSWYKKLLLEHDIIITNSKIATTFLSVIYGIECDEVIYPPIDTSIFKSGSPKKNNQVLIYVGSYRGDIDESFIRELCICLQRKKFKILVLGNRSIQEKIVDEPQVQHLYNITDEDLARIYSESKLTICPQKWETFGYVVAESILCGTPVLAFNCMGSAEIITQSSSGYLVNNKKDFMKKLENIDLGKFEKSKSLCLFDTAYSTKKLLNTIGASDDEFT